MNKYAYDLYKASKRLVDAIEDGCECPHLKELGRGLKIGNDRLESKEPKYKETYEAECGKLR